MTTRCSASMGVALAQGDTLWVSRLGSNEPGLPPWASTLAQHDKDKDAQVSPAELLQDKELGEHFGWMGALGEYYASPVAADDQVLPHGGPRPAMVDKALLAARIAAVRDAVVARTSRQVRTRSGPSSA